MIYTNITDAPLDVLTVPDVIDVPDAQKQARTTAVARLASGPTPVLPRTGAAALPAHYIIPIHRVLRKGSHGNDVIGAKRAIWRANGLRVPKAATQLFGVTAAKQLQLFQHAHGLRADGQLGAGTLARLAPYFDAYAYLLYVGYPPGTSVAVAHQRAFVAYMLWGYNNRAMLHYVQARPMDLLNDLQHLPGYDDCSEWYTKGCKYARYQDPNGLGYNGAGYTGTIAAHGTAVASMAASRPGDAFLYGPAPGYEHVAGCIGAERVVSFGSEPGPLLLGGEYRPDLHMIRRPQ